MQLQLIYFLPNYAFFCSPELRIGLFRVIVVDNVYVNSGLNYVWFVLKLWTLSWKHSNSGNLTTQNVDFAFETKTEVKCSKVVLMCLIFGERKSGFHSLVDTNCNSICYWSFNVQSYFATYKSEKGTPWSYWKIVWWMSFEWVWMQLNGPENCFYICSRIFQIHSLDLKLAL